MVELLSSVAYGLVILPVCGMSVVPDAKDMKNLCMVGLGHLLACKLFVVAICGPHAIKVRPNACYTNKITV
jgi:hypothetical protein